MGNAILKDENDQDGAFVDELPPGSTLMHGQYTIDRFLNAGGFGITYAARDSLDRKVVIKECFPGAFCRRSTTLVNARSRAHQKELSDIVRLFVQEAKSLAKLDHPNIVGVHQVFEENNTAYMALDFVEGRDLLEVIEDGVIDLTPELTKRVLRKVLDAVSFVHAQGVLHRDISPDNILVDSRMEPVLIDFGAAREQATKQSRVLSALRVVKDGYSPQEFYIAGSEQGPYSDLYALGASFYHLITDELPPNSQARLASVASGESDPFQPVLGRVEGYDDNFLKALDKSLEVLPKDRIASAADWIAMMDGQMGTGAKVAAAAAPAKAAPKTKPIVSPSAAPAQEKKSANKTLLLVSVAAVALSAVGVLTQSGVFSSDDAVPGNEASVPAATAPAGEDVALVEPSVETTAPAAPAVEDVVTDAPQVADIVTGTPQVADIVTDAPQVADIVTDAPATADVVTDVPGIDDLVIAAPAGPELIVTPEPEIVTEADPAPQSVGTAEVPTLGVAPTLGEAPTPEAPVSIVDALIVPVQPEEIAVPDVTQAPEIAPAPEAEIVAALEPRVIFQPALPTPPDASFEPQLPVEIDTRPPLDEALIPGNVAESPQESPLADLFDAPRVLAVEISPRPKARPLSPVPEIFADLEGGAVVASLAVPGTASTEIIGTIDPDVLRGNLPTLAALPADTAATADTEPPLPPAPIIVAQAVDGLEASWSVALPYDGLFNDVEGNTRIFAVNGTAVTDRQSFDAELRRTTALTDDPFVEVAVTLGTSQQDQSQQVWQLPVVQRVELLNGLTFNTSQEDGAWITRVGTVPRSLALDLKPNDIMYGYLSTSELLNERDSMLKILSSEFEAGQTNFVFAVTRNGSSWAVSFPYNPNGDG